MFRLWIVLAAAALLVVAVPASADQVTNTFVGTIVPADNTGFDPTTTNDLGNFFGGGNLLGASFTLTMTLDSTLVNPGNPSTVTGGTFYFGPNPITAALTINGITHTINDSSDAFYGNATGYGPNEKYLQAFNFVNQLQAPGVLVDLTTLVPASTFLTTSLPSMLLSNNSFVDNYSSFYDSANNEVLNLNVEAVNAALPVPEPGTLLTLVAGLAGLALIRHLRLV